MSTFLFLALAGLLIGLGVLGCFVAKIPGPLLAWLGLVVVQLTVGTPIDWWMMWIVLPVIIVLSMIFTSKVAPKLAAKAYAFGKAGKWGTFVGSMLTIIVAIGCNSVVVVVACLFILPYIFAFLFELISVKSPIEALKRGGGSYILYLTTTLVKLAIVYACFMFAFDNVFGDAIDAQKEAEENQEYASIAQRACRFNAKLMSSDEEQDAISSYKDRPASRVQKHTFSGEVAGSKCTFNLVFTQGSGNRMDVEGSYYYNRFKNPIMLSGYYDSGTRRLSLTEFDDDGIPACEMNLSGDIDSALTGTFYRPDGKSFTIVMTNDN